MGHFPVLAKLTKTVSVLAGKGIGHFASKWKYKICEPRGFILYPIDCVFSPGITHCNSCFTTRKSTPTYPYVLVWILSGQVNKKTNLSRSAQVDPHRLPTVSTMFVAVKRPLDRPPSPVAVVEGVFGRRRSRSRCQLVPTYHTRNTLGWSARLDWTYLAPQHQPLGAFKYQHLPKIELKKICPGLLFMKLCASQANTDVIYDINHDFKSESCKAKHFLYGGKKEWSSANKQYSKRNRHCKQINFLIIQYFRCYPPQIPNLLRGDKIGTAGQNWWVWIWDWPPTTTSHTSWEDQQQKECSGLWDFQGVWLFDWSRSVISLAGDFWKLLGNHGGLALAWLADHLQSHFPNRQVQIF